MAKRVFKNKRLMRTLLILAGFLIVGFFLWTMLFKRSSVFEGQTTGQARQSPMNRVNNAVNACFREKRNKKIAVYSACLMEKLEMNETDFDRATNNARTTPNHTDGTMDKMIMDLQMHFSDILMREQAQAEERAFQELAAQEQAATQPQPTSVSTVAPP